MSDPLKSDFRFPWIFLLFSLGLCLALFGNVLFGTDQFNYRDEAHYYYPLYHYAREELASGRFPLWTPYSNLGMPFFANAAMGVLYPGKLIFLLPFEYPILFNVFLVSHVFLASWTFYRLARSWRLSGSSATFGALAYALSGGVFAQYSNPIFLIGAAWAPEAILWADRALVRRRLRPALACASVLALMILGGDPQAAFHVGLIAALLALFYRIRERFLLKRFGQRTTVRTGSALSKAGRSRLVLLALLAGTTFCLSAVQILPSMEFGRLSDRTRESGPRSIWEIPSYLASAEEERQPKGLIADTLLFRRGKLASYHEKSYDFSLHPLQLGSFLWADFAGRLYPVNTFWLPILGNVIHPANWVFTCYFGVIPFLFALLTFRFRLCGKAPVRQVWLSWVAVLALLGSFGIYGIGWLLRGFGSDSPAIGDPVGGVYWILQILIPGYVQFRYPAKLLTLAMLPLAMLAAFGIQRLQTGFARSKDPVRVGVGLRRLALAILLLSLFLLAPVSNKTEWFAMSSKLAGNAFSGPFVPTLAQSNMLGSLAQTAVILFLLLLLFRILRTVPWSVRGKTAAFSATILLLTAADLYLACAPTLIVTDRKHFQKKQSVLAEAVKDSTQESVAPVRLLLHVAFGDNNPYPADWAGQYDPRRWEAALDWERDYGLHAFFYELPRTESGHLPFDMVYDGITTVPQSYRKWAIENLLDEWKLEKGLAEIGAEFVLVSKEKPLEPDLAVPAITAGNPNTPENWYADFTLWKIRNPRPRARVEHENTEDRPCTILHDAPGKVAVRADLTEPATVVLADQYWPGWHVRVDRLDSDGRSVLSTSTETIRTIRDVFRGVDLPEGSFQLTFRYDPACFRFGAILSALAWCFLLALFAWSLLRPGKSGRSAL